MPERFTAHVRADGQVSQITHSSGHTLTQRSGDDDFPQALTQENYLGIKLGIEADAVESRIINGQIQRKAIWDVTLPRLVLTPTTLVITWDTGPLTLDINGLIQEVTAPLSIDMPEPMILSIKVRDPAYAMRRYKIIGE
jgi:hypothetical protein